MSRLTIITGCQRSGTTLLKLILSVHPNLEVYDEDEVKPSSLDAMLSDDIDAHYVCKLPMQSHVLNSILTKYGKRVNFLWCQRQVLDVAYSMCNLYISRRFRYINLLQFLQVKGKIKSFFPPIIDQSFIDHPGCLRHEVKYCEQAIDQNLALMIRQLIRNKEIDRPSLSPQLQAIKLWYIKRAILLSYQNLEAFDTKLKVINYRNLISTPETIVRSLCKFLAIEFHPQCLRYYEKLNGVSIGMTFNDRPIDKDNHSKYLEYWSESDIAYLKQTAAELCILLK